MQPVVETSLDFYEPESVQMCSEPLCGRPVYPDQPVYPLHCAACGACYHYFCIREYFTDEENWTSECMHCIACGLPDPELREVPFEAVADARPIAAVAPTEESSSDSVESEQTGEDAQGHRDASAHSCALR